MINGEFCAGVKSSSVEIYINAKPSNGDVQSRLLNFIIAQDCNQYQLLKEFEGQFETAGD